MILNTEFVIEALSLKKFKKYFLHKADIVILMSHMMKLLIQKF
jgi:hypothetical protein